MRHPDLRGANKHVGAYLFLAPALIQEAIVAMSAFTNALLGGICFFASGCNQLIQRTRFSGWPAVITEPSSLPFITPA